MSYLNMLSTITWKGSDGDTVSELVASESGFNTALDQARKVVIQADETIRCMSESWQKLADMLGVEVKRDGLDVDEMARAIEGLKRDAARYVYLKCSGAFRCMSLDMGGKHTWTGIGRPIGKDAPTIDEAIDKALAAGEAGNG